METEDIGESEKLLPGVDIRGQQRDFFVGLIVIGKDLAAETAEQLHHGGSDPTGPADTNGLVSEFETTKPLEVEVGSTDSVVTLVDVTCQRQDETDREFSNGIGRVGRDVGEFDPYLGGGLDVDLVESGASGGQKADSNVGKLLKHGPVGQIIHEDQGSLVTGRHDSRLLVETGLQKGELNWCSLGSLLQGTFFVPSGVEDSDFHHAIMPPTLRRGNHLLMLLR